jgi:uncharacterized protein (DUF2225 family)
MVSTSENIAFLYDRYKDNDDGFLYINYMLENTFGSTSRANYY